MTSTTSSQHSIPRIESEISIVNRAWVLASPCPSSPVPAERDVAHPRPLSTESIDPDASCPIKCAR